MPDKKKIAILVGPGFEDLEFWVVHMRMIEAGHDVVIVGTREGEVHKSKSGGLTAKTELSSEAAVAASNSFDAVLVPGGWAPDKIRRDGNLIKLIQSVYNRKGIVGMICHGGLLGISAGIVRGKKATGSLGIKDDLENAGAVWTDEPAFAEGNLVWGRVVADIPIYCRELIKALSS